MSGAKISEYELEKQRRERLANALNQRIIRYNDAISGRNELLKAIQRDLVILECKKKSYDAKALSEGKEGRAFRKIAEAVRGCISSLSNMLNITLPEFYSYESDDYYCPQAAEISGETDRLKRKRNNDLSHLSELESEQLEYVETVKAFKAQRERCKKALASRKEELEKIIKSSRDVKEVSLQINSLSDLLKSFEKRAYEITARDVPDTAVEVRSLTRSITEETDRLINGLGTSTAGQIEEIRSYEKNDKRISGLIESFAALNKKMFGDDFSAELHEIETEEYKDRDPYKEMEESAKKKYESLLDALEDAVCDSSVGESDKRGLTRAYLDLINCDPESDNLVAIVSAAKSQLAEATERAERFDKYYNAYVTKCNMLNAILKEMNEEDIPVKEEDDFLSIEELLEEEKILSRRLDRENEKFYIFKTIGEIMSKHGYNMKDELIFTSDQQDSHMLFRGDNDNAAIHVACYGEGAQKKIMLEVVGLGSGSVNTEGGVNAAIISSNKLSPERRKELLGYQIPFCKLHPVIISEMKKYGINVNNLILNPPGECHSREIYHTGVKMKTKNTQGHSKKRNRRALPQQMEMKMEWRLSERKMRSGC